MTSPIADTGHSAPVNSTSGIPEHTPISAFCGFPMIVHALPTFAAVARMGSTRVRAFRSMLDQLPAEKLIGLTRTLNALRKEYGRDHLPFEIQGVVMDVFKADGFRRLEGEGTHTPIIAITAYDVYGMQEAALETGCNLYLSKPLNLEELDRAVKSLGFLA